MTSWVTMIIGASLVFTLIGFFIKKAIKILIVLWLGLIIISFLDQTLNLNIMNQLTNYFNSILQKTA